MDSRHPALAAEPGVGRLYSARRLIRSTDVTTSGRLRFDALARYLQTVAEDDLADSGLLSRVVWLVRKCSIVVRTFPEMGDRVRLHTFCSGVGPRWAERTTTLTGQAGDLLQATAVWAAISRADGRPVPPGAAFLQVYGESAQGRTVSARLSHPRPSGTEPGSAWQLRATDFDTAGHVNNAIAWAAVEDVLAAVGWRPSRAEVEYHRAIMPGCQPWLVSEGNEHQRLMWLVADGHLLASARITA